eukprot:12424987-Karenia_brevis.AAC.1
MLITAVAVMLDNLGLAFIEAGFELLRYAPLPHVSHTPMMLTHGLDASVCIFMKQLVRRPEGQLALN